MVFFFFFLSRPFRPNDLRLLYYRGADIFFFFSLFDNRRRSLRIARNVRTPDASTENRRDCARSSSIFAEKSPDVLWRQCKVKHLNARLVFRIRRSTTFGFLLHYAFSTRTQTRFLNITSFYCYRLKKVVQITETPRENPTRISTALYFVFLYFSMWLLSLNLRNSYA